jgi:hypothetical protein
LRTESIIEDRAHTEIQRALLNTEIMEIGIIENGDLESSFVGV